MSDNVLPSIEELGQDFQDTLQKDFDAIDAIEEFFSNFVDEHFNEIPRGTLVKVITDAGNIIDDDEQADIEEFKACLYTAFIMNEEGIEDPKEYIEKVFGM